MQEPWAVKRVYLYKYGGEPKNMRIGDRKLMSEEDFMREIELMNAVSNKNILYTVMYGVESTDFRTPDGRDVFQGFSVSPYDERFTSGWEIVHHRN